MDELIANNPDALTSIHDAVTEGTPLKWRDFARLTGTSESAVHRAWLDGRLPSAPIDSIPIREGIIALVSLGGLRRRGKTPQFLKDAASHARELLGMAPEISPAKARDDSGATDDVSSWKLKYLKAQTAARRAAAKATQMKNDVEAGVLVRRDAVELDAAETATSIASALSKLPERASGMCVGCTADEIAQILRNEITTIMDAIQKSEFASKSGGTR
jgi:hypothetical protein